MSLAYHIEQEWTKDKILTEYLNTVYFGAGAYGIEAAARTYFGKAHPSCGTEESPCAELLTPAEAGLLAGVIQNPWGYDPKNDPGRRPLPPQRRARQDVRPGLHHRRPVRRRDRRGPAGQRRHQGAVARLEGSLLHLLGPSAAGRPLRRRPHLLRRAEGQDLTGPRGPGGHPGRGGLDSRRRRPDRLGGGHQQQGRDDRRDDLRPRLRHRARSTSPPRVTASPARRSSRSC